METRMNGMFPVEPDQDKRQVEADRVRVEFQRAFIAFQASLRDGDELEHVGLVRGAADDDFFLCRVDANGPDPEQVGSETLRRCGSRRCGFGRRWRWSRHRRRLLRRRLHARIGGGTQRRSGDNHAEECAADSQVGTTDDHGASIPEGLDDDYRPGRSPRSTELASNCWPRSMVGRCSTCARSILPLCAKKATGLFHTIC